MRTASSHPPTDVCPVAPLVDLWPGRSRYEEGGNRISWLVPSPGVFYNRVEGTLMGAMYPHISAGADAIIAERQSVILFCDWEAMTRYVPEARNHLTAWSLRQYNSIGQIHFLTRSTVVSMGVLMAGTAFRTLRLHKSRAPFEAALAQVMAGNV